MGAIGKPHITEVEHQGRKHPLYQYPVVVLEETYKEIKKERRGSLVEKKRYDTTAFEQWEFYLKNKREFDSEAKDFVKKNQRIYEEEIKNYED